MLYFLNIVYNVKKINKYWDEEKMCIKKKLSK